MAKVAAVETVQQTLDSLQTALTLYDEHLDRIIPWATFKETMATLGAYEKEYSAEAGVLVGKIKTLLLNSEDAYRTGVRQVYEWCQLTLKILPGYVKLLDANDEKALADQQKLILLLLSTGIKKMTAAIDCIERASGAFNQASGELSSLNTRLAADFNEKSSYFQAQVSQLEREAYGGAAAGLILGPFGLIISYSISAGIVEGKLKPALREKFASVSKAFDNLTKTVQTATSDIASAKAKLRAEVQVISDLKTDAETLEVFVGLDTVMIQELKESAASLSTACKAYVDRHSEKHL
jgi:hemolysin E